MATIPVYRTWVAGEVVTAAYFNANVRDAGNFWLSVPTFEGRQTVAQSIVNGGGGSTVTYDTEDFDNDNMHSTVTNTDRVTPVTVGRYQTSGKVGFATAAGTLRAAELFKNGVLINGGSNIMAPQTVTTHRQPTHTMTQLANGTTDFFQINAFQNSGAAINTAVAGGEQSTFSVRFVGTS